MTALRVKHHPKHTSRIFGLSLSMTETLGKRIICSSTSLIRTGIYTPYSFKYWWLLAFPHSQASTYSATVSRLPQKCIISRTTTVVLSALDKSSLHTSDGIYPNPPFVFYYGKNLAVVIIIIVVAGFIHIHIAVIKPYLEAITTF